MNKIYMLIVMLTIFIRPSFSFAGEVTNIETINHLCPDKVAVYSPASEYNKAMEYTLAIPIGQGGIFKRLRPDWIRGLLMAYNKEKQEGYQVAFHSGGGMASRSFFLLWGDRGVDSVMIRATATDDINKQTIYHFMEDRSFPGSLTLEVDVLLSILRDRLNDFEGISWVNNASFVADRPPENWKYEACIDEKSLFEQNTHLNRQED